MKSFANFFLAVFMFTTSLYACFAQQGILIGSGSLLTKNYDFTGFTEIDFCNSVQGNIAYSNTYSVEIIADDNVFPYLQIEQTDGCLKVHLLYAMMFRNITVKVNIRTPDIQAMTLKDDCVANITGFNVNHNLNVTLKDSCVLKGNFSMNDLTLNIKDDCKINLTGSCGDINLTARDTCIVDLIQLVSRNAVLSVKDDCNVKINCTGTINGSVKDDSSLNYTGNPSSIKVKVSDGSTIKPF